MARKGPLSVVFTPAARADLLGIWHWNALEYGEKRADSYVEFLLEAVQKLAASPQIGPEVSDYPGLRRYLVKRRSRGHGHLVFYRVAGSRLEVIHIYHTAQDWQGRLG